MSDICPVCGLPGELCVCEDIAKEAQSVRISTDKRRYGKTVTIVEGIDTSNISINDVAKQLKTKCAAGGTVKNGRIVLQGDHKKKISRVLEEIGFTVEER
jgi:translation initiation factor 1